MVPFLDLKRQKSAKWESAVARVVKSGWFIGGPELAAFEAAFASYCGAAACVGTANGTDALELALRGVGVNAGDEVVTVANAGMYSTTAIRAVGATPAVADIERQSMLMAPESLSAMIGTRTTAVIVTHLYGRRAPMDAILRAARGVPVIEDCAQAHGRGAGSRGIAGCFSFYPTKNLGAMGDAGGVVTSDAALAERLRALRQYGWRERFRSELPGGRNSRMDEIQAAVLAARLPELDGWNARRRAIAARYIDALGMPAMPAEHVYHLFVLRSRNRDGVRAQLAERGIETQIHYPVPDHLQPSQAGLLFRRGSLEETEAAAREVLSLPCYPEMTEQEVDAVTEALRQVAR